MGSCFSVKVRPSPLLIVLVVCLSLLLSTSSMALAAGAAKGMSPARPYAFRVNTTADTHDMHPGDGKCADKMGRCSLRAATEEADALPSGSHITITVPKGTYTLTLGRLQLTANTITISGTLSKATIINGKKQFTVMTISVGVSTSLSQLTIENGYSNGGYNGGGINNAGMLTVSNSTISNNSVIEGGGSGGGIYNDTNGTVSVSDSILSGGSGLSGGGIYNDGILSITHSTISNNLADSDSGGGGGIYNNGTLTVSDSTFSGNQAGNFEGSNGGGILNVGMASVSDSTFSNNSANFGQGMGYGGGISNSGTASVSDSTFSLNYAAQAGGGIDISYGTVTLTSTIVANNQGGNCDAPPTETVGYNLDSGTSCGFHLHTDLKKTNPKLGPLQDNGGPTQTMALLQGSKAIDWVALSNCPSTDQRGYTRPDDQSEHACDIGAYESAY